MLARSLWYHSLSSAIWECHVDFFTVWHYDLIKDKPPIKPNSCMEHSVLTQHVFHARITHQDPHLRPHLHQDYLHSDPRHLQICLVQLRYSTIHLMWFSDSPQKLGLISKSFEILLCTEIILHAIFTWFSIILWLRLTLQGIVSMCKLHTECFLLAVGMDYVFAAVAAPSNGPTPLAWTSPRWRHITYLLESLRAAVSDANAAPCRSIRLLSSFTDCNQQCLILRSAWYNFGVVLKVAY